MIFKLEELPKSEYEKFLDLCKKGKPFNEVYRYYKDNKLHQLTGGPVVYIFKSIYNKLYVGKAENILQRIQHYFNLNTSYVNGDLKDDLMFNGQDFFVYAIVTSYNGQKITKDNLLDAENWITSHYDMKGFNMYNKTNKKRKLEIRPATPAKSLKQKYKKLGNDFRDIDETFKGFTL
jgi:hypothetical protein